MRATLFLLFLLPILTLAQSQKVTGKITDFSGSPIEGVRIIDVKGKQVGDVSDASGRFDVRAAIGTRLGFDKEGYQLHWERVKEGKTSYSIVLEIRAQEIEEVVITRKTSQEALDITNTNIIDFQPLDDCMLTLKKYKRQYYIGLDSLNREGVSFPINIDRPRALYFDCMRNPYILSSDSAFQILVFDTAVVLVDAFTVLEFNRYIRPCVSDFGDRLVFQEKSAFNKRYELIMYDNQEPRTIFTRFDELGYQGAWEAAVDAGENVDPLDGDTLTSPVLRRKQARRDVYGRHDTSEEFEQALLAQNRDAAMADIRAMQDFDARYPRVGRKFGGNDAWSETKDWAETMAAYQLFTQPIGVRTFQIGNFMAVVDFLNDSVLVLDHQGYRIKSSHVEVDGDVKGVLQDRATGDLYLYTRDNWNHKVFGVDAFTGSTQYVKNFGGMPHTERAIIYDGYLYYKVLERDFYEIHRVPLPEPQFYN